MRALASGLVATWRPRSTRSAWWRRPGPRAPRWTTEPACLEKGEVYNRCIARTNIDIDEAACQAVMQRYHLATKREAVNFALRALAGEALSLERARQLRGSGWEGDLDDMRSVRSR